jgi:DNA-binding PadR family transcriptional regulator
MAPRPVRSPESFLPLTSTVFHVLLALSAGDRHGYGIIREVADATGGEVRLRTGTLYTILKRLLAEGLIVETDDRPSADDDDERRRYYGVTPLGRQVAQAEARRLDRLVSLARSRRMLPRSARNA